MTTVRLTREDRVARLTLDRPPLNIMDLATVAELSQALATLGDDDELQVVTLRGAGGKAFSAGVAVEDHTPELVETMLGGFHEAIRRLRALPALSVAVVEGHCLGGGMELAAACDLVIAEEGSRFGQPEIKLGCFPPVAAALYPARIGVGRTLELLATGRTMDVAEAESVGLVSRRAAAGELESTVDTLLEQLTAQSTAVTRILKTAVRAASDRGFDAALDEAERLYLEELTQTHDMNEGIAAFFAKRAPRWQHR